MIFLILSIVSSSLIFIIFKWLGKIGVNNLTVIVLNYFFAGLIGWSIEGPEYLNYISKSDWLFSAVMLGSCFVGMFYLMARTTQLAGTSPSVVANKMSVVIPVTMAFILYNDNINAFKVLGIAMALVGIYLVTRKDKNEIKVEKYSLLLLMVFIGSGMIDTFIKLIENTYLNDRDVLPFTTVLFQTAFVAGLMILTFNYRRTVSTFTPNKIFLGLLLGSVNFGSIYFLVLALKESELQSSILFPVNNIGIVLLSALMSRIIYREHLSKWNMGGIFVSILSMILLMLGS